MVARWNGHAPVRRIAERVAVGRIRVRLPARGARHYGRRRRGCDRRSRHGVVRASASQRDHPNECHESEPVGPPHECAADIGGRGPRVNWTGPRLSTTRASSTFYLPSSAGVQAQRPGVGAKIEVEASPPLHRISATTHRLWASKWRNPAITPPRRRRLDSRLMARRLVGGDDHAGGRCGAVGKPQAHVHLFWE